MNGIDKVKKKLKRFGIVKMEDDFYLFTKEKIDMAWFLGDEGRKFYDDKDWKYIICQNAIEAWTKGFGTVKDAFDGLEVLQSYMNPDNMTDAELHKGIKRTIKKYAMEKLYTSDELKEEIQEIFDIYDTREKRVKLWKGWIEQTKFSVKDRPDLKVFKITTKADGK